MLKTALLVAAVAGTVLSLECGPNIGNCAGSQCCSKWGWCGTSSDYCGTGCQKGYGTCKTTTPAPKPPAKTNPAPGQCGAGIGSCTSGQCCSKWGYCGATADFCGDGCQASHGQCTKPSTPSGIKVVASCTVPNTVAITFDDGPYLWNADIVSQFNAANNSKVTFFMNGNNYGCIYNYATQIKAAYASGHQIASHTWSHVDLVTLNASAIQTEITKLQHAFIKIIGAAPTYFRPPYGSANDTTTAIIGQTGIKYSVLWDADSGDADLKTVDEQKTIYNGLDTINSHLSLQHETYQTTTTQMIPFIIQWAQSRKLKMVTVGECLGDATTNWYVNYTTPETSNPTWTCV